MKYDLAIFSLNEDISSLLMSLQHLPLRVIEINCTEVFKKVLNSSNTLLDFNPQESWFFDNFGFFSDSSLGALEKKKLREKELKEDKFNKSWSEAASGKVQSLVFRQNFEYSRDMGLSQNLKLDNSSYGPEIANLNSHFVCDKVSISSMVDMESITSSEIDLLLEIDSSLQKSVKVNQLIISMDAQQFYFLFDKYKNYKNKFLQQVEMIKPSWVWTTYEFEASNSDHLSLLPKNIIFTKDIYQHWFNDNFVIFQKFKENNFFCKILIPAHLRFHKQFILKQSQLIIDFLKEKLCVSDIAALNFPLEYTYSYKELGPSWENVYDQFYSYPFQKNIFWNNFEQRFFNPNLFQSKFLSYVKSLDKQKRVRH
jgi:hypothetical protein